jgi:hypothetical protein
MDLFLPKCLNRNERDSKFENSNKKLSYSCNIYGMEKWELRWAENGIKLNNKDKLFGKQILP